MKRRIFAILLAVCMIFTLLPATALAEETEAESIYLEAYINGGGRVSPEFYYATPGENVTFTFMPYEGRALDRVELYNDESGDTVDVTANITEQDGVYTYTIENVGEEQILDVFCVPETDQLYVGGELVYANGTLSDDLPTGVSFDPETSTLTLDSANITGHLSQLDDIMGIYSTLEELNINLVGESTVTVSASERNATGIYTLGSLNFSSDADGSLTVSTGGAGGRSRALHIFGSLTVSGGEVVARSGDAVLYSAGAQVGDHISVTGGSLAATGGRVAEGTSEGIYSSGDVTVSGDGQLTAVGGVSDGGASCGMYVDAYNSDSDEFGRFTVSDNAKLTFVADTSSSGSSVGLRFRYGDFYMSGGTVDATSGDAATSSHGFESYDGGLFVSGGSVTARSGATGENNSVGLYVYHDLVASGDAEITAFGGDTDTSTSAIFVDGCDHDGEIFGDMRLSGSAKVTAVGGKSGEISYGVLLHGAQIYDDKGNPVTDENGEHLAQGGSLYVEEDAQLIAIAGDGAVSSDGVLANGEVAATDGVIILANSDLTRAEAVTALWKAASSPEPAAAELPFADVPADAAYTDALLWAVECGITNGTGEAEFSPDEPLTREQLATMLYRCAQFKGIDVSAGENTNILSFDDAFGVSDWAYPALQWACAVGLIEGDGGTLAPQGAVSRTEIATVIYRFIHSER